MEKTQEQIDEEIRKKEALIKTLRDEVAELKAPKSIKRLLTNKMLNDSCIVPSGYNYMVEDGWEHIRKACIHVFRGNHYGENLSMKVLTKDEVKLAAQMADEMVEIWNKYIQIIYGGDNE